tara:strand:- start:80258 stop:80620 length:363 start_codon:yes stop_codon:yes gene_type:complete
MVKQKGFSVIQFLFWGMLLALVVVIGLSLFPPYMEHMSVKRSLDDLSQQADIKTKSTRTIEDLLLRRFQVNDVKNVKASDLEIDKKDGKMVLSLAYEVRVHLISNIDAVLSFDDSVAVEE